MDCATAAGSIMEAGKARCERVLFAEKVEVMSLLKSMADLDSDVLGEPLAMVCDVAGSLIAWECMRTGTLRMQSEQEAGGER